MQSKIQVVPYDTNWPKQFQQVSQQIKAALGDNCITIHHVGSTAIPGIWAKPIIDMIPVVKDIYAVSKHNDAMGQLGFVAKGEHGMLFRRYFQRTTPLPACNIHIYEEGSGEIERLVLFKNYLNQHADDKKRYADLKRNLSDKLNDITQYTLAKDALIKEIDGLTGFKGYRMVHALTEREWQTYHHLLQTSEPHPDIVALKHQHIVLYEGTEVVGAALLITTANNFTSVSRMALDPDHDRSITKTFFMSSLERWLQHKVD